MEVARLTPVALRDVWLREAGDFSPWLAQNLDALGESLGMDLELVAREAPVGAFSLDILAKELQQNRTVIIENQLEQTDHDHLGKLLTYASGHSADVVVWVAKELREEHRQALDWLNERTQPGIDFFGVVVRLVRIDDSRPAYLFDVAARPNQWKKQTEAERPSRQPSTRGEAYRAFFQVLLDVLRDEHRFTNARTAQAQSWYSFSSGFRGVTFGVSFGQGGRVRTELTLDTGEVESTKQLFDALVIHRPELDSKLGPLSWERLDNRRSCRIALYEPGTIEDPAAKLEALTQWFVASLLRFKDAFSPVLKSVMASQPSPRLDAFDAVLPSDDGLMSE
jgi:hypothetical protein